MEPDQSCDDHDEQQRRTTTPASSTITIDLTNEDDDDVVILSPVPASHTKIKHEPTDELIIPPLPVLEESPFDHEEKPLIHESENLLAKLLSQYNATTGTTDESTNPQDEYHAAFDAVVRKQAEMAERKAQGTTNEDRHDEYELWVLEEKLSQITKLKAKEKAYEDQTKQHSMFVDDNNEDDDDDNDDNDDKMNLEFEEDDDQGYKEAAEVSDPQQARAKERKKPIRNNRAKSTKVRKNISAKQPRRRRANSPVMLNLGSLLRNDIVANAAANQGAGEQPTFQTKNKKNALAALIASIPKEHQSTTHGMKTKLDQACKQFRWRGQGSMMADGNGQWRLKGMRSSLKHFQLLGAQWGCEKEAGSYAPYGGIIADTMGFGKTIQALTIMVENQPMAMARNQTTLIVCTAALCTQWLEEIRKHVEDKIMAPVKIERTGHRTEGYSDSDIVEQLRAYKVVITTYTEVMRHYPKCQPPTNLTTDSAKDAWWAKHFEEKKGPFFRMKFFRIILDEAQIIKNHESRTSKACRLLQAKYKWVLTGTPLSNCLEELFPYFNFLGVAGAGDFKDFKENYGKRSEKSAERLDAILREVMIRRTGADRLFNVPLVSLPALDHQTIALDFNRVEKEIYKIVQERFIAKINDWSQAGLIHQRGKNIFVMLTRLRQMCAHVLMVSTTIRDLLESEDIENLWKLIHNYSSVRTAASTEKQTVAVLRRILFEAREEKEQAEMRQSPEAMLVPSSTVDLTLTSAGFDLRDFLFQLQQDDLWDKIRGQSMCHICRKVAENPKLSVPCGHLYCDECLRTLLESAQEHGMDHCICQECYCEVSGGADLIAMEQIARQADQRPRSAAPAVSAKKAKNEHKWLESGTAYAMSTKVQAITAIIEDWLRKDPGAKIIVFTLFLPMIAVFSKVCQQKGWGYQEYTGKMTQEHRIRALKDWKDQAKEHSLLLMSMRAGAFGLNLTEASYVIIVDPWWNQPMEDQAFSRMYRIGQMRDCIVRRFVINDAVDTLLMLHLQKVKAAECDRVIDGRPRKDPTISELIRLFGKVQRDPVTGEMIVEDPEDDPTDEFVEAEDQIVVSDSEAEEVTIIPSRPQ